MPATVMTLWRVARESCGGSPAHDETLPTLMESATLYDAGLKTETEYERFLAITHSAFGLKKQRVMRADDILGLSLHEIARIVDEAVRDQERAPVKVIQDTPAKSRLSASSIPGVRTAVMLFALFAATTVAGTCSSVTVPSHATGYSVEDRGTYKIINTTSACMSKGAKPYVLYPRAQSPPSLGDGYQYFGVPLQSVLVASTVPISFIESLGKRTAMKFVSQYTTSACAQRLVADNITAGGLQTMVYESPIKEVQATAVEAAIVDNWGMDGYGAAADKRICEMSSSEATSMGSAEWIKFWGHFFDASETAGTHFCGTEGRYTCNSVAASTIKSASSHLEGDSYSYQVPTAVFASFNKWGIYFQGNGYVETDYHDAFEISLAPYKVALVQDAGATYPDLSAFSAYKSGSKYQFRADDSTAVAAFHLVLQHVDAIIDEGSDYGSTFAETELRFKSSSAANPLRAFTNKKVFMLDATMDARGTGGTGSDWFESRISEPDALLEDMIAAFHPGSVVANAASANYMRNVDSAPSTIKAVKAADCTGDISAIRPARSTTCVARGATAPLPSTLVPSSSPSTSKKATGYSVCQNDGYKVITSKCGGTEQHYVLYPRAQSPPDLGAGFQYFGVPLQSVLVASTVPISFIENVGARTSMKVISQYTTSACAQKLVADGGTAVYASDTKNTQAADVEAVIVDNYGMDGWTNASKLICETSTAESTSMGSAEWIKFWGHFFDASQTANSHFCGTDGRYMCNSVAASDIKVGAASGEGYAYQVPTAVFASLNTWGIYIDGTSGNSEADYHDAFEISLAPYKVALVQDAGATYPDLSAFSAYKSGSKYQFRADDSTAVAAFHLALQHVDAIIDDGSNYGSTFAETELRFKSSSAANPLRAFTNKKVFTLDATMDARGTGGTGSDWFESRISEPDALLEDMIAAFHSGSVFVNAASANYLRNVDSATIKAVKAADCTGALTAGRPARSSTCAALAVDKQFSFLDTFAGSVTAESHCANLVAPALPTCALEGPSPVVTATFTLSGTVSDYDDAKKAAIVKVVAKAAGVSAWRVALTISAGSVVVSAAITVTTSAAATSVQGTLTSGIMASASALQTELQKESALASITVSAAPTLAVAARAPPSAPSDSGLALGLGLGLGIPALVVVAVVVYLCTKGGSAKTQTMGKSSA